MKLVLAEPKYFTDSISIISEMVNEVTLKIYKDKLEIIAMDPANVAMVAFTLLSSAFAEYKIDKIKDISINLEQLRQVLKRAKPSDTISLSLDEKKNKLKVDITGNSKRSFNLALINIDEKEQKVPDLSFPISITAPTYIFDEAIEDMGVISDALSLIAEKNKLTMDSSSNLHSAKVEIQESDDIEINATDTPITSKYSLEYLKKMIKTSKLSSKVKIQFNKDYPLRLDYLVKDKMNLTWILAPRISD